ncbi:MAG: NUDIX domain-containing protein [Candidatus Aenigmarchaeota archaeon]|nr:NUDIX domain-containing protein [Candidatus Aenigmarchaeota archaeon]
MANEFFDIVDENDLPTGIQKPRSVAHRDGLWHRVIHVWIYNSRGEVLLQLRQKDKDTYPNVWDLSVGGHVTAGSSIIDAAKREVFEEVGLNLKESDLEFYGKKKSEKTPDGNIDSEYHYVYLLKYDGLFENLKFQEEEIQKIQFITLEDLEKNLKEHPEKYLPRGDYWTEMIGAIRGKMHEMGAPR